MSKGATNLRPQGRGVNIPLHPIPLHTAGDPHGEAGFYP
jgi:hypothetical protein